MALLTDRAEESASSVVVTDYRRHLRRQIGIVLLLLPPLVGLALLSIVVGASSYGVGQSWSAFWHGLVTTDPGQLGLADRIVWELRVPRMLMAIIGGMGLAVAGLIMQTILRNPLADAYTLGISSAASFGAALAIILQTSLFSLRDSVTYDYVITINSFLFALLCTAIVYAMTTVQRVTPETIVLLGVAMMFLFTALTSLLQYLGNPEQMAELTYWMFGSLNKTTWTKLAIVAIPCALGLLMAYRWSWDLNTMIADDQTATSSGVNVARVRLQGLALAALLTATVVSIVGPIGFIGLVAPHLARMLVGGDHRFLFPVSWLLGAIVLLLADTIARTVAAPVVIPVGILTAFVGVPLLISLMLRRKVEHW